MASGVINMSPISLFVIDSKIVSFICGGLFGFSGGGLFGDIFSILIVLIPGFIDTGVLQPFVGFMPCWSVKVSKVFVPFFFYHSL